MELSKWATNDSIIICTRASEAGWVNPEAVKDACELCNFDIWAAPSAVQIRNSRTDFHIICRQCVSKVTEGGDVLRYGGRITPDNREPWRPL